jgi:outer membrane protein OmpA-like peptidoglycan-associated protein
MKKQVLSFNEFIFEAYRVYEAGGEGAGGFNEALVLLKSSGASGQAMEKIGDINGISKLLANKENTAPQDEIGEEIVQLIQNLSNKRTIISKTVSKVNTISYNNVVANQVMTEGGRTNILDFIYEINLGNVVNKSRVGSEDTGKGDKININWEKVSTSKRWASMSSMSSTRRYKNMRDAKGRWGRFFNFVASFFERDPNIKAGGGLKDTRYLLNSGLLGNNVITDISNGIIKVEPSEITHREMFMGGRNKKNARDPKGLSNVGGNKKVVKAYTDVDPLGAELTAEEKFPTKGSSKISKTPKGYFTLVLYSLGPIKSSTDSVSFSELELQEKIVPQDDVSVEYTVNLDTNDSSGKPVLFAQNGYSLSEVGKNNIDLIIEQFYSIKSIKVIGFASDEGTDEVNADLCKKRSAEVTKYIKGVKEWNLGSRVTDAASVNIQPEQPSTLTSAQKEEARKVYRKVQLIINGTKIKLDPKDPKIEFDITPTVGKFFVDSVDIYQTILTFEVEAKKTSRERK